MRFESFFELRYLIILLAFVIAWILYWKWSKKRLQRVLGSQPALWLTRSLSVRKRAWKLFFQVLGLAFVILALARPQAGQSKEEIKSQGVEVVFLVDVSESMMTEDSRPSRLEQAKSDIGKMVDQMGGNKIGLVAFAGSATVLSPLTSDPNSLHLYIDSLSPISVSSQGTNFQRALLEAKEAFRRGSISGSEKDAPVHATRVIIMASDGEDHEEGAVTEAQNLEKDGIKVFTLAYGTEKGGPIPDRDALGFLRGYKKDKAGQTILSQVHGDALREIAQSGKGSFYHAVVGGDHMQRLLEDLNHLEKTEFDSQVAVQYEEKYQILLLVGIVILFGELFLNERRRGFKLWKGRFEVPTR